MMGNKRHEMRKRITAWMLLVVMGINCFGQQLPAGTVHATDYEKASEEAEETIRAAERAAGIGVEEEETGDSEEDTEKVFVPEEEVPAAVSEEGIEEGTEEDAIYEPMTISKETTLTEDMEVGDLQVSAGLHLNGHKLVVHGNVYLNSFLYMEEGYLATQGDFQDQPRGLIAMSSPNDYILIEGDYIYSESYYYGLSREKGTFEVHGNIRWASNNYCRTNVVFGTDCKVVLGGSNGQQIDIRSDSLLVIRHLVIANTSEEGVFSKHILAADVIEDEEGKLHYPVEGEFGAVLTEDMEIAGDYCLLGGTLDLAGHNLIIHGDLIHAGGILRINGGSLMIDGNYRRQLVYNENGVEREDYSVGRLVMNQETDYVLIKGDYVDSGLKETGSDLSAGVLELQGSIRANNNLSHPLLQTTDTHTVKLTGAGKQMLQTGNTYSKNNFQFSRFVVAQPEGGSAEWGKAIVVTGSVAHESANITGVTSLEGAVIQSTDLYGDVQITDDYKFQSDVTLHGNLSAGYKIYARTLTIQNCHVTVKGNYYHTDVTLKLTGETPVFTVEQDFVVIVQSYRSTISNGTIEIGGNITKTGDAYLACGENAVVCFNGTEEQRVSIPHADTLFTNVVVDNPAGVVVEDGITVVNVTCKQGVLSYASGAVHGFTVEEDGEYDGDLVIGGGVFDLNGHYYHVKGNLTIAGGALNMTHESGYLLVDGDFKTASTLNHTGRLTNGTLEVKGNFTQAGNNYSFIAANQHTVLFSGEQVQTVTFASENCSAFANVIIQNDNGVSTAGRIPVCGNIKQNGPVKGWLGARAGITFESGTFQGDVEILETVTMSQNLAIDGNLKLASYNKYLYLNGKELNVTGQVSIPAQTRIELQKGHLICGSFEDSKQGYIYMQNATDRLTVYGNLSIACQTNGLKSGHIKTGGDIVLQSTVNYSFGNALKIELNGTDIQTITMSGSNQSFGTLILNNTSKEGVYIAKDLNYTTLENPAGTKVTFANGGILGYTLQADEVVEGDLLLSSGTMDLNGHSLTVTGNLLQSGGTLNMNGGTLIVEGDYALAVWTRKENGDYTYDTTGADLQMQNEEEILTIKGNFYNYNTISLSKGILNIEGNWEIGYDVTSSSLTIDIKGDVTTEKACIFASNACNWLFTGERQQIISTSTRYTLNLGNVIIDNPEGIKLISSTFICFNGDLLTNGHPIEGDWINLYGTLKEDRIQGNLCFQNIRNLEKDLYVDGNVSLGELCLNGHHLTATGDCILNYTASGTTQQKNGILEVKGDLKSGSYNGTGTNQVILSGDKKQTIYANNMSWQFHELIIQNTSEEGVYSQELLNADIITDPNHKLSFPMEGDVGYTLTKDTVIQGDFTLLAGNMDLNGYKLTVMGNLTQRGGKLDVNGGSMQIYGDYILGNPKGSSSYQNCRAVLKMDSDEDYVCAEGNVVLATGIAHSSYMTAGTLDIKGNLTYYRVNNINHYFVKNFRILFSGEEKQNIVNTAHRDYFYLPAIDIQNISAEGVVITSDLRLTNPVTGIGKLQGAPGTTLYWKTAEPFYMESWNTNLCIESETALTKDLNVAGTLTVDGVLNINGKHLTTDFMTVTGTVNLHGGILQVKRNVEFGTKYNSKPTMVMDTASDILQITGDLTGTGGTLNLTAGHLDVKGNLNLNGVKVNAGDAHTTTLSGKMTSRGTAYIQTVTIPAGTTLNTLVLTKPRNYYVFNRDVEGMCRELIEDIQDITAPSVPGGLSATEISYTNLKLSWQASTDDTGVAGYDVYRDEKKIMSVAGTSYTDKNLTPGTKYSYYVIAKDATLNTSATSNTLTVATLKDEKAPEVPEGLVLAERMGTALKINWQESADNVKTAGYRIFRDGKEIGTTKNTEYLDSGLNTNASYSYTVSAYDEAGNESEQSEEGRFYTQAVEIGEILPAGYAKLSGSEPSIQLSFTNAGSAAGYQVYIGYREITKGNTESSYRQLYSNTAGKGTAYRRQITVKAAVPAAEIQSEQIEVLVRITDAGGYTAEETYTYYLDKSAPSKLSEVGGEVKDGVAVISYAKGVDADIAGYYIYRADGEYTDVQGGKPAAEQIADIQDVNKTYYYDKTIEEGLTYTYYVAAYDEEGQIGEWSDPVILTGTADEEAPVIENVEPVDSILSGRAELTIQARDNKALDKAVVEIYREDQQDYEVLAECPFEQGKALYSMDTTQYSDEITLCITVLDAAGNENETEYIKTYAIDNKGPEKIRNLSAKITSTTVVLTWDAPEESDDFAYFLLEEQQEDGSFAETARTTTVTGYAVEGLIPHSIHTYRVTGYDIRGNAGEPSNPITITVDEDTIAPRITSVSPQGGYFHDVIPLSVTAYDNLALSKVVIEYSLDQENWQELTEESLAEPAKQYTLQYDYSLEGVPEGDCYIRAYAVDAAGNAGDTGQILIQYKVDKTAPSAVGNLTAEGMAGSIRLKWNEPVDNDVDCYRVYRSIEGLNSYTCVDNCVRALGWYDQSAAYGTAYSYRITAVDRAGNESGYSNTAAAQKLPDDEAPVIHNLLPDAEEWISGEYEMSAYVTDNDRLSQVEFAIREQDGNATKMVVDTVSTSINQGAVTCKLDTTAYANGVYQILVTAKDASGNTSKTYTSVCHISNVTLPEPKLYAAAGNWCTDLHYSGNAEESYVLYKKKLGEESFSVLTTGTGSLMYRDLEVHPSYTYVYQLLITDRAGNTAVSVLCEVKPLPVDDRKPAAVLQADTSVVEGYQVVFNALDSTDNDRIKSYTWDFGDGSGIQTGPTPVHTYNKAGEYYVTLTVADPAGNTADTTVKMTVLPKNAAGKAVIEVRNAAGTPLSGVTVFVNTSSEQNDMCYTDKHGTAAVMQRAGTYRVALYKPGYVATEVSVEIELHGERNYVFTLAAGETMTADFNVRQMTFEEMVEAGIDISDPANQHVFTVETELVFKDDHRQPEGRYTFPLIPAKSIITRKSKNGTSSGGGGWDGGGGGGGNGPLPPEEPEEPGAELYYTIHITQSISWLKDMYEATLIIYNNANSQTIVAKNLSTKLILPSGISLAGTSAGQSMTKEVPDIRGGESQYVTWYLRGDTPGTYKLNALMTGKLQPFDAELACSFESNEFDVTAGDGLVLTIQPEDRAEKDEQYYVYFTLSNEGYKEFYNVYTTFGTKHNNSRRFASTADRGKQVPVMSAGDCVVVECLKPGESISGIYKTAIPVEGEKYFNYKSLLDYSCKVLEGANLGVKVRISPVSSHVPVPNLTYQEPTDENSEADPVNVSTGAFTDSIAALSIQGVNPVSADLSYDSAATEELGEFGYGWTHNYEARILDMKDGTLRYYVSPTGYYTFLAEDYEKAEYKTDADGYYYLDPDSIPAEQNYKCLNDNKAGYVLKRNSNRSFTLTDQADTVMKFDNKGNLTSIKNPDGKEITVSRTNQKFTVADAASGRKLTYTLNENKLVEQVADSTGREAFFYYDENKCLKQFTNALGENTYYTYDKKHRILTVTDDDGNTYVTNTYKEYDNPYVPDKKTARVVSQKDGLGNVTKFSYNEDEQSGDFVTTVTTRSGKTKKTVTDAYGNITCTTNEAGDAMEMTFDADGNQTAIHNANGYDTVYKYDSDGNLTTIENSLMDNSRAETVMKYDSKGNMTSMVNANGESMSCTYYDNGLIKSVTDQNGNMVSYTYNSRGQVTEEKDGNGKTVTYEYNSRGDLIKTTDKNGNTTSYTYNDMGLPETTTVKDGSETYITETCYDDLGRTDYIIDTEGGITSYEYDCAGNIISRTDPAGAVTVYAYDANQQMVKETVYPAEGVKTAASTTDYTYTKEGLLKAVTDGSSGTVVENSYDAVGNKTKEVEKDKNGKKLSEIHYEYDKAGSVTKQTRINVDRKEGEPEELSAEYTYYPNGNLNTVTDTAGKHTTYTYDKSWRVQMIVSDTEPTVSYKYDDAGRVLSETISGKGGRDEDKLVTSYTYDIYGNVAAATDAKGNTTKYRYDGNGNLTETEDAAGRVFYSKYDARNRVTETGMRAPGEGADIPLTRTAYSIKNHTITETDAVNGGSITTYYDEAGRPVKTVDGDNTVLSETIYDTEGRVLQTVDARGMVTENVYNALWQIVKVRTGAKKGNSVSGNGLYAMTGEIRETEYTYDQLGRNTKVTDAEDGVSSVVFDGLGRIKSLRDPNQNAPENKKPVNTYEYAYNAEGLVEQEKNAVGNVTRYQYNSELLLQKMTDSENQETEYKYDSLNRLKEVEDDLGTITYTYDANGNITEVAEKDKGFSNLFAATKTISREFDSLNRVTKYTDYKGREVRYAYDALGNMAALTYPGGEIVNYAYNADGSVSKMTSSSGGTLYTWEYAYDQYGRLIRIKRPDGTEESREYNSAGDLVKQTDRKGSTVLQENTYVYDVFGEITEKSTTNTADPKGLQTVSMEYDAANRLTKYNGQTVKYDAKGNMTTGPVDGKMQELTYDCRNRLVEAGGVSYTYDAENTRISSTVDGRTTEYVTDTGGSMSRLLAAYEADGTETRYYYGTEGLAGQYNDGTGERLYYHYDNIGSTTLLTDVAGKVADRFVYGTYGELLSEVTKKVRFLYNGAYGVTTDDNGLYYMRARYYNPDIKRFINQDIKVGDIGSSQSLNRYAYCEGNPVSLIDPFGLSPEATQDQGQKSKYEKWHNALDFVGLFWDGADVINAALYAKEKDWANAAICAASALPAIGAVVVGVAKSAKAVIKAKKAAEIASLAAEASRMTKKAADTLDTFSDTMRVAEKYGKGAIKSADNILADVGGKLAKALETGGDFGKEASKAAKSAEAAGMLRLSTKADDAADALKVTDFYAGPKGVARSLEEYDAAVKGANDSNKLLWGKWDDYKHITIDGNEYAEIGDRFYTRHAVARMQPSGMRYSNVSAGGRVKASRIIDAGELDYGRSISPNYIEDIINRGTISTQQVKGVERTVYSSGSVDVITEQKGKIVITIKTY